MDCLSGTARQVAIGGNDQIFVTMNAGDVHEFDVLYTGLGVQPRTHLAVSLGATLDESGAIVTDSHGSTSVDRLYAAGDVVSALDQINVAVGQATIAAMAIHNSLSVLGHAASRSS
jgi:thioredoxin reductase (NADPH)